ncbi:AMP-binding protein [Seohaeicola saemankumensis]|uniref:AMP-binding protein n=1 Tax=Seohaeicola TaxID=481178 RepID=UPI0035D01F2B
MAARHTNLFRDSSLIDHGMLSERTSAGELRLRSPHSLNEVARNICEPIEHHAARAPDSLFLAQRQSADQPWTAMTYAEAWKGISAIGSALLSMGFDGSTPLAILTPNSLEHAMISFACMAVGVPVCPVSPAYSTLPETRGILQSVLKTLRPRAVFVQDGAAFSHLRDLPELTGCTWISATTAPGFIPLSELMQVAATTAFRTAYTATQPDATAKILFTSGSTGAPKGVINTQHMLCSNAASFASCSALSGADFVLLDWMPWHHTMGGNFQLNTTALKGGALYIDNGRPLPGQFTRSIANICSVSPSLCVSVPAYFQMLVDALRDDVRMRTAFFARMRFLVYAGAKLQQSVVDAFQSIALEHTGQKLALVAAYGATETAPGICMNTEDSDDADRLGVPLPGVELRLLPVNDRYEIRVRGPNVFSLYLGNEEASKAAFDEEGFYRTGDTVFAQADSDGKLALGFGGRLSENFKLDVGAWVIVADLRAKLLQRLAPLVREVCLAGENRPDIRALFWLDETACRARFPGLTAEQRLEAVQDALRAALTTHNEENPARTQRVHAFATEGEPPQLGAGEVTDKGNINQRRVLERRAVKVDLLYAADTPDNTIHSVTSSRSTAE